MGIDWTKPIWTKNGLLALHLGKALHDPPVRVVAVRSLSEWKVCSYDEDGIFFTNGKTSDKDLENIPDTHEVEEENCEDSDAEPPIDLTKPVQVGYRGGDKQWHDLTVIHQTPDHVYGYLSNRGKDNANTWDRQAWRFRNTPEPEKRVQGWINIYDPGDGYLTAAAVRNTLEQSRNVKMKHIVARIYIDVPYGHGLEGGE